MKSLIQAAALAVVLAAPVASFAQQGRQQSLQNGQEPEAAYATQTQTQAAGLRHVAQANDSGYGVNGHGTWQSGRGTDTTVSSYSPPIYNAR